MIRNPLNDDITSSRKVIDQTQHGNVNHRLHCG